MMDYTQIVQEARQFFQGHPGKQSNSDNQNRPICDTSQQSVSTMGLNGASTLPSSTYMSDRWRPNISAESPGVGQQPHDSRAVYITAHSTSQEASKMATFCSNQGYRRPGDRPLDLSSKTSPEMPYTRAAFPPSTTKMNQTWPEQQPFRNAEQTSHSIIYATSRVPVPRSESRPERVASNAFESSMAVHENKQVKTEIRHSSAAPSSYGGSDRNNAPAPYPAEGLPLMHQSYTRYQGQPFAGSQLTSASYLPHNNSTEISSTMKSYPSQQTSTSLLARPVSVFEQQQHGYKLNRSSSSSGILDTSRQHQGTTSTSNGLSHITELHYPSMRLEERRGHSSSSSRLQGHSSVVQSSPTTPAGPPSYSVFPGVSGPQMSQFSHSNYSYTDTARIGKHTLAGTQGQRDLPLTTSLHVQPSHLSTIHFSSSQTVPVQRGHQQFYPTPIKVEPAEQPVSRQHVASSSQANYFPPPSTRDPHSSSGLPFQTPVIRTLPPSSSYGVGHHQSNDSSSIQPVATHVPPSSSNDRVEEHFQVLRRGPDCRTELNTKPLQKIIQPHSSSGNPHQIIHYAYKEREQYSIHPASTDRRSYRDQVPGVGVHADVQQERACNRELLPNYHRKSADGSTFQPAVSSMVPRNGEMWAKKESSRDLNYPGHPSRTLPGYPAGPIKFKEDPERKGVPVSASRVDSLALESSWTSRCPPENSSSGSNVGVIVNRHVGQHASFPHKSVGLATFSRLDSDLVPKSEPPDVDVKKQLDLKAPPTGSVWQKSASIPMPFKFRTKAELKQMKTLFPPLPAVSPAPSPVIVPPDPILSDEKWEEWINSFTVEWDSFVKDLSECDNIKRICRLTKPTCTGMKGKQKRIAANESKVVEIHPPKVMKKIEEYSSDEDVPLSLRKKAMQSRMRAERLKRRKMTRSSCSESSSDEDAGGSVSDRLRSRRTTRQARIEAPPTPPSPVPSKTSSNIYPGWEREVLSFKKRLRIPAQLINVSRPKDCIDPYEDNKFQTTLSPTVPVLVEEKKKIVRKTKSFDKRKAALTSLWVNRWKSCAFRTCMLFDAGCKGKSRGRCQHQNRLQSRRGKAAKKTSSGRMLSSMKTGRKTKRLLCKKIHRRRFRSRLTPVGKTKEAIAASVTADQEMAKDCPAFTSSRDPGEEVRSWVINTDFGETSLHHAARLGYLEGVNYLLESPETDVAAKDHAGLTPLHIACANGHLQVTKVLLQHGADENSCANDGSRPLSEAVENDHLEIVRLLLSYGADPSVATRRDRAIKSRTMVDFLAAVISDYDGGNSHSPWVFEGSSFFMDAEDVGFDPLDFSGLLVTSTEN